MLPNISTCLKVFYPAIKDLLFFREKIYQPYCLFCDSMQAEL
jgi:hypothetical protein